MAYIWKESKRLYLHVVVRVSKIWILCPTWRWSNCRRSLHGIHCWPAYFCHWDWFSNLSIGNCNPKFSEVHGHLTAHFHTIGPSRKSVKALDGSGILRTWLHRKTFQIRRSSPVHHSYASLLWRQTYWLDISRFLQRKNLCPDRRSKSLSKTGWHVDLQKISSVTISSRGSHFITRWQSSGTARLNRMTIWKWPMNENGRGVIFPRQPAIYISATLKIVIFSSIE